MHHGEMIQKAIKERTYPISQLCIKLHHSRQWVYNLFEKSVIPIELLVEIGSIIKYDFSSELKSPKKKTLYQSLIQEDAQPYSKLKPNEEVYKEKYFQLLEQHKVLNEKYIQLLEKSSHKK